MTDFIKEPHEVITIQIPRRLGFLISDDLVNKITIIVDHRVVIIEIINSNQDLHNKILLE